MLVGTMVMLTAMSVMSKCMIVLLTGVMLYK